MASLSSELLIDKTITFVKKELKNAEGGHDWFHIERVYKNAMHILKTEEANHLVVALGALLHDIADSKFHDGDETIGPKKATEFLISENISIWSLGVKCIPKSIAVYPSPSLLVEVVSMSLRSPLRASL